MTSGKCTWAKKLVKTWKQGTVGPTTYMYTRVLVGIFFILWILDTGGPPSVILSIFFSFRLVLWHHGINLKTWNAGFASTLLGVLYLPTIYSWRISSALGVCICTHGACGTLFHQNGINISCLIMNILLCMTLWRENAYSCNKWVAKAGDEKETQFAEERYFTPIIQIDRW